MGPGGIGLGRQKQERARGDSFFVFYCKKEIVHAIHAGSVFNRTFTCVYNLIAILTRTSHAEQNVTLSVF